ncbi:hypothetical protein Trydic_g3468 [Trypoxylus dichotomus]
MDNLLCNLREAGFYAQGYADDIAVMVSGKFEGMVCERMQVALRLIETWCRKEGLNVNYENDYGTIHLEEETAQTPMSVHFRLQSTKPIKATQSRSLAKDCLIEHYGGHGLNDDCCNGDHPWPSAIAAGAGIRSNPRSLQSNIVGASDSLATSETTPVSSTTSNRQHCCG